MWAVEGQSQVQEEIHSGMKMWHADCRSTTTDSIQKGQHKLQDVLAAQRTWREKKTGIGAYKADLAERQNWKSVYSLLTAEPN